MSFWRDFFICWPIFFSVFDVFWSPTIFCLCCCAFLFNKNVIFYVFTPFCHNILMLYKTVCPWVRSCAGFWAILKLWNLLNCPAARRRPGEGPEKARRPGGDAPPPGRRASSGQLLRAFSGPPGSCSGPAPGRRASAGPPPGLLRAMPGESWINTRAARRLSK